MRCIGAGLSSSAPIWVRSSQMVLVFYGSLRYQSAMSKTPIEELAKKLADAVPQGVRAVGADLEDTFKGVLRSGLGKLDLVTREEFEVQEAVLRRTREKLEALEARLGDIEGS